MQDQLENVSGQSVTGEALGLLGAEVAPNTIVAGLKLIDAGRMKYGQAWDMQQDMHADTVSERIAGAIIIVEHPAVVTLGKNADQKHLKFHNDVFRAQGIDVVAIDRGGEVTAHEPGQLVVYPILKLSDFDLTPKKYVNLLEETVIATLGRFGVRSHVDPHFPGVWVGSSKICAIGIRIKDRATMHGIGFNVQNDLSLFEKITPCGIQGRDVTTLSRLVGRNVSIRDAALVFLQEFERRLEPRRASAILSAASEAQSQVETASSASDGLLGCCVNTINLLALHNPMMVCSECKQIIKCFTSDSSFRNYLTYCRSSRRPFSTGQTGQYQVVVFKSYDTYHR